MEDSKWKLESDLCRCCLTEGSHTNLGILIHDSIASEEAGTYANMMYQNLGIRVSISELSYIGISIYFVPFVVGCLAMAE